MRWGVSAVDGNDRMMSSLFSGYWLNKFARNSLILVTMSLDPNEVSDVDSGRMPLVAGRGVRVGDVGGDIAQLSGSVAV